MITIDKEAKMNLRSPLNTDNMAERYKTTSGYYVFTSPSLWVIEKNLFLLLKNSTIKSFKPRYYMKPDYLSYDEYNTTALSYLLMYVNNVFSAEDFDLDEIIVPEFSTIVKICQDKKSRKNYNQLQEVDW